MANKYHKGNSTRISCPFTVNNVLTDPTTVTLTVKKPDASSTSYTYGASEIQKASTGNYYKDIELDQEGIWLYRWEGTGDCNAVSENYLQVMSQLF
jgi:hypothetical protein